VHVTISGLKNAIYQHVHFYSISNLYSTDHGSGHSVVLPV